MSRRKMNYPCEENMYSNGENFNFRVYKDVAVDLESSYSDSSDMNWCGKRTVFYCETCEQPPNKCLKKLELMLFTLFDYN